MNEFSSKDFAGEDVRDGIVGAVAVKIQDPVFESQTKNKLGSTDVKPWITKEVKEQVILWLHRNPEAAEALLEKVATERAHPQRARRRSRSRRASAPRPSRSGSRS